MDVPLLAAKGLSKTFASRGRRVAALQDVAFTLKRGETLGLVGPSGSGKSTLARVLMRLIEPQAGSIHFNGDDWLKLEGRALRERRGAIQMVFQDPLSAFNPRATIGSALAAPLRVHGFADGVAELLARVGLTASLAERGIHEVSGGQRQRVAIARALATRPSVIVFDEAVSALDASVRGQILQLIADLQQSEGLAYLFVSHDLAAVRVIAHRIAVMDQGRIVECGPTQDVVSNPQSSTLKALVAAVPRLRKGG
ncbi:putative ATP-binding component of ABC transporter [Nitratireductor indicus C115]|uniref:Putative ATP-binding component of ABC transporter n=1 Tax=Nitratireductor indicus C115 TaxID=1231190 RepID=K2NT50_9HYPH|nr:ATP-binding cassette domain-containing protein [Nitratireductor indicus]EKF42505.1 putative ATP-binding component of ABC transporter [Nitratireductor indicus C115]SFQ56716.1 peptide/nickel transport system ATP-binding protein [Nitratireductor indicus]